LWHDQDVEPDAPTDPVSEHDVTSLLRQAADGADEAAQGLIERVYSQLRKIAQKRLAAERKDHTLNATELVHEAYLKMAGQIEERDWKHRGQFYAAAAEAMRRILLDYARSKGRKKRGGDYERVLVNVVDLAEAADPDVIIALDEALQQLEREDPQLGRLVRLRFYTGLSIAETAEVLEISERSVKRHWAFARAYLLEFIKH
jgi:RNA polymerase sigma factor (TIGR02999 family)